ncbi:hypothetical protein C8R47DRAFT_1325824 [Mycena vitilis]|nr:hypothetical protein C8R47DRAFT_1325824 [Mycena vitilis]
MGVKLITLLVAGSLATVLRLLEAIQGDPHVDSDLAYKAHEYLRYAFRVKSDAPAEKGLEALYASLTLCPTHGGNLILPSKIKELTAAIMNQYRSGLVPDPTPDYRPQSSLFPLSIQAQREAAVDEFWSWMPTKIRSDLEHTTHQPDRDSYSTLASMSKDPDSQQELFCKYTAHRWRG